jgi:hypothetical protein
MERGMIERDDGGGPIAGLIFTAVALVFMLLI